MQKRSPKFEFHPLDLKKTVRDLWIFFVACWIPALIILTDAYIKWDIIDMQIIWVAFATPFIWWILAWINRWATNYTDNV